MINLCFRINKKKQEEDVLSSDLSESDSDGQGDTNSFSEEIAAECKSLLIL